MSKKTAIKQIICNRYLNSCGDWTIGTLVELQDGSVGFQTVPKGTSAGEDEALDIPPKKAVKVVTDVFGKALIGKDAFNQTEIDNIMCELDGTRNKKNLGSNSILSVSLAVAKASAASHGMQLYQYLGLLHGNEQIVDPQKLKFPTPLFNILNGGKHSDSGISFQEFMVIPSPELSYEKALEMGVEIYGSLENLEIKRHLSTAVGAEGGFAPKGLNIPKALDLIMACIPKKYKAGKDVFIGIDAAANSFVKSSRYNIKEQGLFLNAGEMLEYYVNLVKKYPIIYLEDPFYEKYHKSWRRIMETLGDKLMIVGDDLVVTNPTILRYVVHQELMNAVIVKPNQVGTLTETLEFIKEAQNSGLSIIVSHRSRDTAEDTFVADLALAVGADFLKSGSPARGERTAKYNRLLGIFYSVYGAE